MKLILTLFLFVLSFQINAGQEKVSLDFIEKACERYKATDCNLVKAIAWTENRFRNKTVLDGDSLSYGMMQVKCDTARMMGLKFGCDQLRDPLINLRFAILYIEYQIDRYHGNLEKVLASYNAGSAIRCENLNPGRCFPGEFINHNYVYQTWRKYQWLANKRHKIVGSYYLNSKRWDTSEKQTTYPKSDYLISSETSKVASLE